MNCHVSKGDQPVKMIWMFNGQNLTARMGVTTQNIGSRTSLLTISNVLDIHSGNYTCMASNAAGTVNHTAVVQVKGTYKTRTTACFSVSFRLFFFLIFYTTT